MAREAPLFGIGVGRFFEESARLASPELRRYYSAQNAHNQVIQFLGELGVPGAALFLAVLACSLAPGWRGPDPSFTVTLAWPGGIRHPGVVDREPAHASVAGGRGVGGLLARPRPCPRGSRHGATGFTDPSRGGDPGHCRDRHGGDVAGTRRRVAQHSQPGRCWHRGVTVASRCPGGYPLSHRQGIVGHLRGWPTGAASTAPSHGASGSRDDRRRCLARWPPGRTSHPAVRCLDRACRCFFRARRSTGRDTAASIFAGRRPERRRGSISGASATSTTPVRLPQSESEGDSRA